MSSGRDDEQRMLEIEKVSFLYNSLILLSLILVLVCIRIIYRCSTSGTSSMLIGNNPTANL